MNLNPLGETLKAKREEQNLTLKEISDKTRIHIRYLQAIESGEFSRLPGELYAKSFVRQYARALGFSVDEIAATLDLLAYETGEQRNRRRRRERKRPNQNDRSAAIRGVLQWVGVALFLAAFWYVTSWILGSR